jgi:asparagine synthase (glutamine-hydrolysing)
MCGIAGLWSFDGGSDAALRSRAVSMADALRHRGPDDDGVWVDGAAGIALSFRRLAILDLSQAGAQPMVSESGRYVLVFNGEIFNFERLRNALPSRSWRGHSDTEVLLACIEEWGLEKAIAACIGMFAIALWDRANRTLTLVRDRLGVKPLYYSLKHDGVAFASELKAMPERERIDRGAAALYTRFGYVPSPWSIYEGIRKLPAGCMLTIEQDGTQHMHAYWNGRDLFEQAIAQPFAGTEDDALIAVEELLRDSVRLRLVADVPVGLFLSGGIDSALVAAIAQREIGTVSTFTIGFEGASSESVDAMSIARFLGTRHTEQMMRVTDTIDLIPRIGPMYDEPMGDSSALPTYLVSRLARQSVTVALSGDGGDEFFGGYHRYFLGQRLAARVARVPRALRTPLGRVLSAVPWREGNRKDRARGLGRALLLDDPMEQFLDELDLDLLPVRNAPAHDVVLTSRERWPRSGDPVEQMMYLDAMSYLADDILPKVDRASMAMSLEVREPLLDHRLVELAWSLPLSMKLGDRRGKLLLRRLLAKYLPGPLIDAGKRGFGLPLRAWLQGPLRDWAASLVDPKRIEAEGFFDPEIVRSLWNGRPDEASDAALWRLLMFQAWLSAR